MRKALANERLLEELIYVEERFRRMRGSSSYVPSLNIFDMDVSDFARLSINDLAYVDKYTVFAV